MRRPLLSHLVPVNEFRANLSEWFKKVESTQRPVVITRRGRTTGVLVSPSMLDELEEGKELVHVILRGLHESNESALVDDDDLWGEVDTMLEERGVAA